MKTLISSALICLGLNVVSAQHTISELEQNFSEAPRFIVIELYTDWCAICAIQSKKIEKSENLVSLLEKEFYYVRFNAESTESFTFNGQTWQNKEGKIHEFARAFTNSNSFPAWIILNMELEVIFQNDGLLQPEQLTKVLKQIL